jgi:DNA (cytosine-5)-methyltransferase 1
MTLTVTDMFCGAGGSSQGAELAGGQLRLGLNHNALAIATHNTNFPHADHDCADVSQTDPRRYPTTDILLASPECTEWTSANGRRQDGDHPTLFGDRPAQVTQRRATMWDVVRFLEHHRYQAVIVENVVDVRKWVLFDVWLAALRQLGYQARELYLNSLIAHPTPQSRDRLYVVIWRAGNRAPDLAFRPRCWCPQCERDVEGVQSWKHPTRRVGKYPQQYLYRCPACTNEAAPYAYAAANAIDWTLQGQRIGDRKRPLAPKTMRRIEAGLRRYATPGVVQAAGHTFERPGYARTWPATDPLPTQTATLAHGVYTPPLVVPVNGHVDDPASNGRRVRPITDPHGALTRDKALALLIPAEGRAADDRARMAADPLRTQTGRAETALVLPFITELYGSNTHRRSCRPATDPLGTVTAEGNHHALVQPPAAFLVGNYSPGWVRPATQPYGTVTGVDHHSLLVPPDGAMVLPYYRTGTARPVTDPLNTLTTRDTDGLVTWDIPAVEACEFRMLQPHESKWAMAFPRDYVLLGTKRQQVALAGAAVTPPMMRELFARVAESLGGAR